MSVRSQKDGVAGDVDNGVSGAVFVDTRAHPLAALTRACYALADVATFELCNEDAGTAVRIFPIQGLSVEAVTERFRTALVDFTLRENIEARTKGLRELIWQTAFGEIQKRRDP